MAPVRVSPPTELFFPFRAVGMCRLIGRLRFFIVYRYGEKIDIWGKPTGKKGKRGRDGRFAGVASGLRGHAHPVLERERLQIFCGNEDAGAVSDKREFP